MARAAAARIYSAMSDHAAGAATFPSHGATPVGAVTAVSHSVDRKGIATTGVTMAPHLVPRDFAEFLPPAMRRVITGALLP